MPDRVVVINDDCVESGGAAAVALGSVRLLRRGGVPTTLMAGGERPNPELAQLGAELVMLGGRHLLDGFRGTAAGRGIFDLSIMRHVSRWISENDTPGTVYHLHNWHKVMSPSVFHALRPVTSRLVMSAHDYFLACPNGGYFHYPKQRACDLVPGSPSCAVTSCDRRHYGHKLWRLARDRVRRALIDLGDCEATILAVHEGMVPLLERSGIRAKTISVLRNPVVAWRGERVEAEQNRTVYFVGRVEEDKGVDLVARACRQAGASLRIIGGGSLAVTLGREYPEAQQLGWQSREQIGELIADARMVAAPTRWRETFGLVALEALKSGIPVIASRFSLVADEIVEGGFGAACDPHDTATLATLIRELLADDRRVEKMSRRAFASAGSLAPDPDRWRDDLLALYEAKIVAALGRHPVKPRETHAIAPVGLQ